MTTDVFGIGLTGKSLTDLERRILRENSPYAVVLFGRNIASAEQLVELIAEVKGVARKAPLIMIDQEGGRVDRVRNLIPGLPSAEAFAEGERAAELAASLGHVTGSVLRYFDMEVDLAPVVDVRGDVPTKGLERRTFGRDPETVIELAGAFMDGLHRAGVASCLKHWPGIGQGSADPHYGATIIDSTLDELMRRDLVPFQRLGRDAGAIMIGHGNYPQVEEDPDLPASLSWRLTTDLLRNGIGFDGVAVSDDMEMHAVSDLGSYEDISERALMAGNDVILFCSHTERTPDLQEYLRKRVEEDERVRARFEEAVHRCDAYRAHCERLRAAAPRPASWDAVVEEAAQFVDEFRSARVAETVVPEHDRRQAPRKGRTGREEWT